MDVVLPGPTTDYDYGNNVIYQDGNVYVNGQDTGSTDQNYEQTTNLAATGQQAAAAKSLFLQT